MRVDHLQQVLTDISKHSWHLMMTITIDDDWRPLMNLWSLLWLILSFGHIRIDGTMYRWTKLVVKSLLRLKIMHCQCCATYPLRQVTVVSWPTLVCWVDYLPRPEVYDNLTQLVTHPRIQNFMKDQKEQDQWSWWRWIKQAQETFRCNWLLYFWP